MKKFLAVMLTLALMIGLVACGGSDADAKKVADYVAANEATLKSSMETSFASSSGLTCTSTIKTEGCKIVLDININEWQDIDASIKSQLQATYDAMDSYFDAAFDLMQKDLPEMDAFIVNVCEKDGDVVATVKMD